MKNINLLFFSGLGLSTAALATEQLTYSEVKNLPLHQLAERALGEAGKLMMDVERPRSKLDRSELMFFSRAFSTGSQYGICGSDWVTLNFDEHGVISSLRSENRYGVEASIYKNPEDLTYQEYDALCNAVTNTRSYFPAPDAQSALTIAAYIDFLSEKEPSKRSSYAFECTGSCANIDARKYVKNINMSNITRAQQIDCEKSGVYEKCYELTLKGDPPGLFP